MPGTDLDLTAYSLGETFQGSFSATPNECDVLAGRDLCPIGTRWLALYCDNAARLGHGKTHASKDKSSTLVDTDAHEPIPAKTWVYVEYAGGARLLSSATASGAYRIKPLRVKP